MRAFVSALAVLVAYAGFGQIRPAVKPVSPPSKNGNAVRNGLGSSASSDANVEKAIRARFAKSKISADRFSVHVQGGIATIDGKTEVLQHKGTATRIARSAGAAQVVNKIQVSEEAKARARSNLATGRRRVQIKRSDVAGRQ